LSAAPNINLNPTELEAFYGSYFSYYNGLEALYQKLFIKRCLQFISEKEINGADDFKVDDRVKALVAASAVQLTLGLETWNLNYFEEIELHASDFDSTTGTLKYIGETNLQGLIKLSWKSFMHGYKINDDNVNLGLHEFSHALRFNSIKGNDHDYFIDNYFNKWLACAYEAFYDLKNKRETIFRSYGGTNINEFLSVCIEHYFESPEEIIKKYPLLYYATGILLNQYTNTNKTKLGIRAEFLSEQNKHLAGFTKQTMQNQFLKHWSFKLWAFVFAILIYNMSTSGILNPITLILFLMFVCIFFWYHYNAVKFEFNGKEILIEKGSLFFKKRKTWVISIAQLISLRTEDEWIFTYYSNEDAFFYEEKINPPKGVNEAFIANCKQNKIAVLR